MKRILYLHSSLFGHDSVSNKLADEILELAMDRNMEVSHEAA